MTQATTLIAAPDPDDNRAACPAGLPWCNDVCIEYTDEAHHSSGFDTLTVGRGTNGETTISVSVFRTDLDGEPGPVQIFLGTDLLCDELILTAPLARQLAAILLNAADDASPAVKR